MEQLGSTGQDSAVDVAIDATGNLYVAGYTDGDLGSAKVGSREAWIAKYNPNGNRLWLEQGDRDLIP